MGLKLGVMPTVPTADPAVTAAFVRLLEELGCESVWAVEHVVVPGGYTSRYPYDPSGRMSLHPGDDVPDPLHWLTFAAACTSTLRLGTAMLILPEHHPVVLAKRLATLDVLSGGRLYAGVGVGWLREEYDAVGAPFERRGKLADEYLGAMRALWTGTDFMGPTVTLVDVHSRPLPVRPGGVPIVVGGHSPAAVRRAARFGSGWYPLGVSFPRFLELLALLRTACEDNGRDAGDVEITMRAPSRRDALDKLVVHGVSRVVIRADPHDLAATRATVTRYRREMMGER